MLLTHIVTLHLGKPPGDFVTQEVTLAPLTDAAHLDPLHTAVGGGACRRVARLHALVAALQLKIKLELFSILF